METIPVSDELVAWLDRCGMRGNGLAGPALHGMGAGTKVEEAFAPATANSGRDRAPIGMGKTGSRSPRQVGQGRNVNTDRGEAVGVNYGTNIDAAMANAMSRGRVYRARPLLIALDGGLSGAHG